MIPLLNPLLRLLISSLVAVPLLAQEAAKVQTGSGTSDQDYARGVQLHQKGDLEGARRAYEAALRRSPRRIDALSNLGLAYAGLRQYDRAEQSFRQALEIDPGQPMVLFNLGITYLQTGKNEEARRTLAALAASGKATAQAHHYLGVALLKLGRMQEGIGELELAVRQDPGDNEALYTLASAYIRNKQLDQARQLIDSRIGRMETAEAHLIAGSYHLAAYNYNLALDELRRAQQLNPALVEMETSLGRAYAIIGNQEMATRLFEAQVERNPSDVDALKLLGWLYAESHRASDAREVLNRALRIRPEDADVLFELGRLSRESGDLTQAAELLERVVAAKPDHTKAHVLLAQIYFRLKKTEESNREREIVRLLNEKERAPRTSQP
jgi:tetratricopeptide (TPR) repeat protein